MTSPLRDEHLYAEKFLYMPEGFTFTPSGQGLDYPDTARLVPGFEAEMAAARSAWHEKMTPFKVKESTARADYKNNPRVQLEDSPGLAAMGRSREDTFVFCNFNAHRKWSPAIFATWMRILRRVPNSILWVADNYGASDHNVKSYMEQAGIDPARLSIAETVYVYWHNRRLTQCDLW